MRLTELRVERYKSFFDATKIELRPITVFFGYNSSGKSALMRLLPLLDASVGLASGPINFSAAAARNASFADLASLHAGPNFFRVGLSWGGAHGECSIDYEILNLPRARRQLVERFTWRKNELELSARLDLPEDEYAGPFDNYLVGVEGQKLQFVGLTPPSPLFAEASEVLKGFANSTRWLGSLRELPRRVTLPNRPRAMGPKGEEAIEILADDSLARKKVIVPFVNSWYLSATEHHVEVQHEGKSYFVVLRPKKGLFAVNVADTGEGMAQVLPVAVLCAQLVAGQLGAQPVLALEQPELHLHPRAHAPVASLLCKAAVSHRDATVLVETHSEQLLLGIQHEIIDRHILPEQVIMHWIHCDEEGRSYVTPITFDALARPSRWPPGVFSEDTELARDLVRKRLEMNP